MLSWIIGIGIFFTTNVYAGQKSLDEVRKVRVSWESVPDAVGYELILTKGKTTKQNNVVVHKDWISTPGCELDTALLDLKGGNLYWKVRGLDIEHKPIGKYTQPTKLSEGELDPQSPLPTTQFDKFPYAKMYPVYSWIPVAKANGYDLQVYHDEDGDLKTADKLILAKEIEGQSSFDYYDDTAYREAGRYWWRVRAKNSVATALGKWSEPRIFQVEAGAKVAALGDSITHGGGAVSVPPSDPLYDWESYTGVAIRNLGYSGNTVSSMVSRFNDDVLAFKPEILVIMGGINDLRAGTKAVDVINGLNRIKYKCLFYNITPVFVTVTPINPYAMRMVSNNSPEAGWLMEEKIVNEWIARQPHYVEVTKELSDFNGWLRPELSTDGLHPDVEGKKIIGKKIGEYLKKNFPNVL